MAKLTLSVDDSVVTRAKQYARTRGVSISEMVETWLAAVAEPTAPAKNAAPILHAVRGVLKKADIGDYRKHLEQKYK